MKTRLISALVAVLVSLCVENAEGNEAPAIPPGMPASLPIGDPITFRSWIVTNRMIGFTCGIYFTNTSNQIESVGRSGWRTLDSLSAYQELIASVALELFNEKHSVINPSSMIRFASGVKYDIPELSSIIYIEGIRINTNIGLANTIVSNSFVNVPPQIERGYVHVPGLEEFKVEVPGVYSYTWPVVAGRPEQKPPPWYNIEVFPPELTTNNYIVLNPWYSMGTNDAVFSVKVGGTTRRFTGFGEALDAPPTISMNYSSIMVTFPRGARVSVETSSDFASWSVMTNFTDSVGAGFRSVPYIKNQPKQFFRVGTQ